MWMPNDLEVFAKYVEHARERAAAGDELTRRQLIRSREQLELSRKLLNEPPPSATWPRSIEKQ